MTCPAYSDWHEKADTDTIYQRAIIDIAGRSPVRCDCRSGAGKESNARMKRISQSFHYRQLRVSSIGLITDQKFVITGLAAEPSRTTGRLLVADWTVVYHHHLRKARPSVGNDQIGAAR